jgi:hypothetical protein
MWKQCCICGESAELLSDVYCGRHKPSGPAASTGGGNPPPLPAAPVQPTGGLTPTGGGIAPAPTFGGVGQGNLSEFSDVTVVSGC